MQRPDAETELFLKLKAEEKKKKRLKAKKAKENKENKPAVTSNTARGALNATNMHYHAEEKQIQQYYKNKFTEKVIAEKGEVAIQDEMIIDVLAYAAVRLRRKANLESMYGRFMDRTANQDPVAQILNCIKSLGLKNNVKGTDSVKDNIGKLLGENTEEMNNSNIPTFEEWKEAQLSKGFTGIKRRELSDFADDENYHKVQTEINEVDSITVIESDLNEAE